MTDHIPYTDILGVNISALTMPRAVETIEDWVEHRDLRYACGCPVYTVMECRRNPALRDAVNGAGIRMPDGMPMVWLSHLEGHDDVTRIYGPDLMLELASRSAQTGHRHFFYGGAPGVADQLAEKLSLRFPGLNIAGTHTPPILPIGAIESEETIGKINESEADIVWVGIGSPKQDWWVKNHRPLLSAPVLIAVGAAFDFHTGRVRQAPSWMQQRGLEWLFRLSQDPKRLWKRYTVSNIQFLMAVGTHYVVRWAKALRNAETPASPSGRREIGESESSLERKEHV